MVIVHSVMCARSVLVLRQNKCKCALSIFACLPIMMRRGLQYKQISFRWQCRCAYCTGFRTRLPTVHTAHERTTDRAVARSARWRAARRKSGATGSSTRTVCSVASSRGRGQVGTGLGCRPTGDSAIVVVVTLRAAAAGQLMVRRAAVCAFFVLLCIF